MNALVQVAEDDDGNVIVLVDWEGFFLKNVRGSPFGKFILRRLNLS